MACFSDVLLSIRKVITYIHITILLTLYSLMGRGISYSSETPMFYQNNLAMRNTVDVTGGKPIAVLLQSILGVCANNPLVVFYEIHKRKRGVLFFYFLPDTTRGKKPQERLMCDDVVMRVMMIIPTILICTNNCVRCQLC
jgi:hypothetical protein